MARRTLNTRTSTSPDSHRLPGMRKAPSVPLNIAAATKLTHETIENARKHQFLPTQVMVDNGVFFFLRAVKFDEAATAQCERAEIALQAAEHLVEEASGVVGDKMVRKLEELRDTFSEMLAGVRMTREKWEGVMLYRMRAEEIAKDLAPYVHARLANVTLSSDPENPPPAPTNNVLVLTDPQEAAKVYQRMMELTE